MTAIVLVVGCLLQHSVEGQSNPEENPYSGSPSRQDANFYRENNMSRSDAFASNHGPAVTISNTSSPSLWLEQVTYYQVCSVELSLLMFFILSANNFGLKVLELAYWTI